MGAGDPLTEFIPGLQLAEIYYHEAVRPILAARFPGLAYSAALIGWGSDVIGFDTPVSRDHYWGPRLYLFLRPGEIDTLKEPIYQALRHELPVSIRGYSTHFGKPDLADGGTRVREDVDHGPVDPLIEFHTLDDYWRGELGVAPGDALTPADWLTFQEHRLLTLTAGKIFHDELGLEEARARFAYFPRDVWLYMLSAQWLLIAQEEAFAGRTAQVGDEIGSRVITGRLAERYMRLCFLMERRYAPYSKWFGTAFQRLACYPAMAPLLGGILGGSDYAARDPYFARVYTALAEMHNALGITPPLEARTRTYAGWHMLRAGVDNLALDDPHNTRPFQVIFGERFVNAIQAEIRDPQVLALIPALGSVNQFLVESSDAVQNVDFCRRLRDQLRQ